MKLKVFIDLRKEKLELRCEFFIIMHQKLVISTFFEALSTGIVETWFITADFLAISTPMPVIADTPTTKLNKVYLRLSHRGQLPGYCPSCISAPRMTIHSRFCIYKHPYHLLLSRSLLHRSSVRSPRYLHCKSCCSHPMCSHRHTDIQKYLRERAQLHAI